MYIVYNLNSTTLSTEIKYSINEKKNTTVHKAIESVFATIFE